MMMLSFSFSKKKIAVSAVLAAAIVVICSVFFSWKAGIIFAGIILLEGCGQLHSDKQMVRVFLNVLWTLLCIAAVMFSAAYISDSLTQAASPVKFTALNILCVVILCAVFYLLTARFSFSIIAGTFLAMLLITANIYVFEFRGKELLFTDLMSFQTAMNVVQQYKFTVSDKMAYIWIIWLTAVLFRGCLPKSSAVHGLRDRLITLPVAAALIGLLLLGTTDIQIRTWKWEGSWINGTYLNFFLSLRDSFVDVPDSYSVKTLEEIESDYAAGSDAQLPSDLPNIIVIMNESFADFNIFGNELQTNQPVTPFVDSLRENTIRGYALTSVFGGNTANAEFEFLTSHSMGFLPTGTVAYQQHISGDIFSLAQLMPKLGYTTFATHPYYTSGWSRTTIFPYLGLNTYSFVSDYEQKDLIRNYVSDREMYRYVLKQLDERGKDKPLFLFGITMQNHGGYRYEGDNFTEVIQLTGYERNYPSAQQYMTLLYESDLALEGLLSALSEYEEDTIVLFFGDHFPRVENGLYNELHGSSFDTLDEQMLQYTVPFLIWANFDIPEQTVECTSLNYLSRYLLDAAGIPLPPYYQFLDDMEAVVPALNALGYYSISQGAFIPLDEAAGQEAAWLEKYAVLQYNNLFDDKNRSELFFQQYFSSRNK